MHCVCDACTAVVMHFACDACNVHVIKTEQMHCSVKAVGLWHLKMAVVKKQASKEMFLHGLFVTHKYECNFVE